MKDAYDPELRIPARYLKSYSKGELAGLYEITLRRFCSWIEPYEHEIGEYLGKSYTPRQVRSIFNLFDLPPKIATEIENEANGCCAHLFDCLSAGKCPPAKKDKCPLRKFFR